MVGGTARSDRSAPGSSTERRTPHPLSATRRSRTTRWTTTPERSAIPTASLLRYHHFNNAIVRPASCRQSWCLVRKGAE